MLCIALPLNEGEKIVIRILDYTRSLQGIDSLGFHPDNLAKVKRMMEIPNGIILTTGATGSGKSTTTYSILQGLNKTETNVITVEDPIEMNIEGINQVQVNAEIGMTFAAALRSILRQDPNVILIGEIRDSETAQIAVRASITGHLVLSTIHTNNSLATIERLLDMDVERYLLSTALTGIISQRLGKQVCQLCRYQRPTTKYEKKIFKKYLQKDIATVWDANPNGCDECRKGYKGRVAFHEVLELDDSIRMALNNENLEKKELAKMVYSSKTITMLQDALIKCLEGKTSFEEVYRAIEIENEDDDDYQNEISQAVKEAAPIPVVTTERDDLLDDDMQGGSEISTAPTTPGIIPSISATKPEEKTTTEEKPKESMLTPVVPPATSQTQQPTAPQQVTTTQAQPVTPQQAAVTPTPVTPTQTPTAPQPITPAQVQAVTPQPVTPAQVQAVTPQPVTPAQVQAVAPQPVPTPQTQVTQPQQQLVQQAPTQIPTAQELQQAQQETQAVQVRSPQNLIIPAIR